VGDRFSDANLDAFLTGSNQVGNNLTLKGWPLTVRFNVRSKIELSCASFSLLRSGINCASFSLLRSGINFAERDSVLSGLCIKFLN
jgi:hypothetical protein